MLNFGANVDQLLRTAAQHHHAGRLPQAEALFRQVLQISPNHPDALHMLGTIALQVNRHQLGIDFFRQAIAQRPTYPEAFYNLAHALDTLGHYQQAIDAYHQAIAQRPNWVKPLNNLGVIHQNQGHLDQAIQLFNQALALDPTYSDAYNNLGNALVAQGLTDDAIAAYRQAVALNPRHHLALNGLGSALVKTGHPEEAIAAFRHAITLQPDSPSAHDNLVYALQFHPAYDARAIAAELRRWNERHALPLGKLAVPHPNDRNPDRPLRIGYVSSDFRDHVLGRNILPLLRNHNPQHFECICYYNAPTSDHLTREFKSLAAAWRDIRPLSDSRIAEIIREDRIDILVDLSLHMAGNRLLVFARKPAPIQVTFAGYPGSTGLTAIDYRLTDPYLDPPDTPLDLYSESSLRLPHTFWCYDPLTANPEPVGPLPALTRGHITFGCLNNYIKVNDQVLQLWAQVLSNIPNSHLLLRIPKGSHRERCLKTLHDNAVAPHRIDFHPFRPHDEYLKLYHDIDIGLDTFPYNGHTTSLDSLWMGVPVVTLAGATVVGRAGVSQLQNLGLPELIAQNPADFIRIATELAADLPRLQLLRSTLREKMQASPLMDAPNFAKNIEAAYRQIWQTWCAASVP